MKDILFKTEDWVFSYRVAGVCIENGKVLLQKPRNDTGYAFPGGHVSFGESNEQTLIREFREEIGADISVGPLMWVGELFFPWGDKPCQQICLFYSVELQGDSIPRDGVFTAVEKPKDPASTLEFFWVEKEKLSDMEVYPVEAPACLTDGKPGVRHFVYHE